MDKKPESFIFYQSFAEAIKQLPENQQLTAFWAIVNHAITGEEQEVAGIANIVYTMAKPQIEANIKKRNDGAKGGRPKKETDGYESKKIKKPVVIEEEKHSYEDEKPNVNVNDNDNGNVNENKNGKSARGNAPLPKKFIPPTVQEVVDYCKEKSYIYVNAEAFVSYYESVGWKVGKNKMQNWKSSVSGWEIRERKNQGHSLLVSADGASEESKKEDGTYWG